VSGGGVKPPCSRSAAGIAREAVVYCGNTAAQPTTAELTQQSAANPRTTFVLEELTVLLVIP
jgi:inactivated superfamily I helicase